MHGSPKWHADFRLELRYYRYMAEQYVATDKRTGLEVQLTGDFPSHPDERIRIARTTNLFARLLSTVMSTENDSQRKERFLAVETQMEMADALIREDMEEVQRLMQQTMERMGIGKDQLDELARKIVEQFGENGPDNDRPSLDDGNSPLGGPPFPIV